MDVCFRPTETFIFEFVRGCSRYETWCLANRLEPQAGWDIDRAVSVSTSWKESPFWSVASRILRPGLGLANPRLHRMIYRIRPRVIHAHFGPAGCQIRPYATRRRIPFLTSFYGFDASVLPRDAKWRAEFEKLFAEGAAFLAEGPAMADRLAGIGCPTEKIHILPITIDLQCYTFRTRALKDHQKLQLLFVGRFTPKKGLAVLLPALARARNHLGDFQLRVIGSGSQEQELRQITKELQLESFVEFIGFKTRLEMVAEMESAHVLVVPSVTGPDGDSEGGAPTILLEAQAMGLPVLGSDHADIPYVVAPEYRRYLAAEGSVDSLAERLTDFRRDADQWPSFGIAGRKHVETQHGPANFVKLEQLYDLVASRTERR